MPLYDYCCADCGPFRAFRPMRESSLPSACPVCGSPAQKMITAPFLADMNPYDRIAWQRNEKSAHEPQVMSRAQLERSGRPRSHVHHAHSHGSHGNSGDTWVRSNRPWMIGH